MTGSGGALALTELAVPLIEEDTGISVIPYCAHTGGL